MAVTITTTNAAGQVVKPDFSWSYSRIKNYDTCPFRYQQIDVLKNFKESDDSGQLKEGFAVHAALADRIDKLRRLPPTMPYEHWVNYVMQGVDRTTMTFGAERKLAITENFEPCDYFDKIKKVWLRTVADVLRVDGTNAHIVDWKTGKVKPDPDQLLLIGSCVMAHFPQVTHVCAELIWLGFNTKTTVQFGVEDIMDFWKTNMFPKVKALQQAHETSYFPPTKSGLCKKYCVVKTCDHCGQ